MMAQSIKWKLNLKSSPCRVFHFLTTDEGRKQFWAEETLEKEGYINFQFINGITEASKILDVVPNAKFSLHYFQSDVTFLLEENETQGTDLTLLNTNINEDEYMDMYAGWLSVLFALKGAVDFGIDLRNHNPNKTWDQRYVEN